MISRLPVGRRPRPGDRQDPLTLSASLGKLISIGSRFGSSPGRSRHDQSSVANVSFATQRGPGTACRAASATRVSTSRAGTRSDRSRLALVALQSGLRYIVAPSLGPLPRPGSGSSGCRRRRRACLRVARLTIGAFCSSSQRRDDRASHCWTSSHVSWVTIGSVKAFVGLALMGDPADVDRVRQESCRHAPD